METHELIKYLRERLGLSQETLATKVGYKDRSSIAKIEAGQVDLSQSKIAAFAQALGVSPAELISCEDSAIIPPDILPLPPSRSFPLIGDIACGVPILAEENISEYVDFPGDIRADFCLRCRGDSMIEARILDGDIVFVRQQPEVENGEIAVVLIDDEATLKRVYRSGDTITLMPANPAYTPLVYTGPELEQLRILGKAVSFLSRAK